MSRFNLGYFFVDGLIISADSIRTFNHSCWTESMAVLGVDSGILLSISGPESSQADKGNDEEQPPIGH